MRKIVNIYPSRPILSLKTPIYNNIVKADLSVGDIAVCIYSRAIVDEVLEDGTTVRLSLSNYNKDNRKNKEEKTEVSVKEEQTKVIEDKPTNNKVEEEHVDEKSIEKKEDPAKKSTSEQKNKK